MLITALRRILAHPLTAGLDLDDPATTALRKEIINSKPFLRKIYDQWYEMIVAHLPKGDGQVLEIGSGAGYCAEFIPGLITSEVFQGPAVRVILDARRMPIGRGCLRAIVMTNVLHHMSQVTDFFTESCRCLRSGGKILMIEPWVSNWSKFVYRYFHHEPFDPDAVDWSFSSTGPVSGANGALPWILFVRDRVRFEKYFPELSIDTIRPFLPFRYMLSGGVGMRSLMPGFTHDGWVVLERLLETDNLAMFAFIVLSRR